MAVLIRSKLGVRVRALRLTIHQAGSATLVLESAVQVLATEFRELILPIVDGADRSVNVAC